MIGAGSSGLACAYQLKKLGLSVKLLEAEDRAGGKFGTIERNGFVLEGGPQSFMATPPILNLISELDLDSQLLRADPKAPRYVLKNKKLVQVPISPPALLKSSLLSIGSRIKIVLEALGKNAPPAEEESVSDFVCRKFGLEVLDRLVAPFVSGIYAGDPDALSLRAAFPALYGWEVKYGSVIRGAMKTRKAAKEREKKEQEEGKNNGSEDSRASTEKESTDADRPTLCSFRGGMKTLTDAMRWKLADDISFSSQVISIKRVTPDPTSGFEIEVQQGEWRQALHADAIVVAAPAFTAAKMLGAMPGAEGLGAQLGKIPYAPLAVVNLGYKRTQVGESLHGFGVLIPRTEGFRTLGTVWNSSLFPESAPQDCALLTGFVGGATDPAVSNESDEEILKLVETEMQKLFATRGKPVESQVWRYANALPQYNLGHLEIVKSIHAEIRKLPGIFLVGNYLEGPSIGQCIDLAERRAKTVAAYSPQSPFEPG